MCDPCHANTKIINGTKTRILHDILLEIRDFFTICINKNIYPGGIHLEMSGCPITECISDEISLSDLSKNYQSKVDPRLNHNQMLETAFYIASIYDHLL